MPLFDPASDTSPTGPVKRWDQGSLWDDDYGPGGDVVLPSEEQTERQRQRAAARATAWAGRAVKQRVSEVFGAGGPAFRTLAYAHGASTAGDTLIAVALANSLFFQVPSGEARGNVALYLVLTMAPFAVIGPLLGKLFDRPGAERTVLIGASLIRVAAAVMLIIWADTIWLFPLAFSLLVLSRVHGIARSALLPQALSNAIALITANARLAQVSVIGGGLAAPVAAGLAMAGSQWVLAGAALIYGVATWQSVVLPGLDGVPADTPVDASGRAPLPLRTPTPLTERSGQSRDLPEPVGGAAEVALALPPPPGGRMRSSTQLRLTRFATAVVRFLNGYLVLILAFAFRDVEAPIADFGAVLAAAGAGYGLASLVAPVLERSLREEPMVVASLAVEAAAAFLAAQFFGLPAAAFLSLAAGYAWGTAKFAFDGLLQGTVAPGNRGRAFTRSETVFQLAWVVGAIIPTGLTIDVRLGLILAGVTALVAQTLYVSRLLQRQ